MNKLKTLTMALISLALVLIIAGCKKDNGSVNPANPLPAILLTPDHDIELFVGETFHATWQIQGDSKNPAATLDGNVISTNIVDQYTNVDLGTGTHIFKISCSSIDGVSRQKSITITVKDLPTMKDTLCDFGPWKGFKLEFQNNLGMWEESEIRDCIKDNLCSFYQIPEQKMVYDNGVIKCDSAEPRFAEGLWTLSGSTLHVVGYYTIVKLSQDTLVWVYDIGVNVRETFIHPPK
jgi:hypothetical protein